MSRKTVESARAVPNSYVIYNTIETIETPEKGQNFITELSEPLEALTERQRTVARQARLQPDPHRSSWSLD